MRTNTVELRKLIFASLCLSLCLVLPFITGRIPEIGQMFLPMHIPVLICGFVCGPLYGMSVGFLAPGLNFLISGARPLMPWIGVSMMFELAVYGMVTGLLYALLKKVISKNIINAYISLTAAMLLGRVVYAVVFIRLYSLPNFPPPPFLEAFSIPGAFLGAVPGIVLQLVLIPLLVIQIDRMGKFSQS